MATQINPYLTFNGNCEEAFTCYKSVFGGEYLNVHRFKDLPPMPGMTIDDKHKERIMNIALPINEANILYGSDGNPNFGQVPFGKNVTLSISTDSKEKADKIFNMLADGGTISMPMGDMFWGAYFGMCDDKFGISWMISFTR